MSPSEPGTLRSRRPARVEVRFDKFAVFDIARESKLTGQAAWLLVTMCLLANWRTHTLRITFWELAEYTRMSRTTISAEYRKLLQAGVIAEVQPFGQHRDGELEILVWERLIVPRRGSVATKDDANIGSQNAEDWRSDRGAIAELSANHQAIKSPPRQQGKQGNKEQRNRATRESEAQLMESQSKVSLATHSAPAANRRGVGMPPHPGAAPYFRELPLDVVGVCRHCSAIATMSDEIGPVCRSCRLGLRAALSRPADAALH